MADPQLFQPLSIGQLQVPNAIVVSPMCQYSAIDGNTVAWHAAHLGSLAMSGAGMLFVEATAVEPAGRITPQCVGLYNDENHTALAVTIAGLREISDIPVALQIGHAGRKASCAVPWQGGRQLPASCGGWPTVAPSALVHGENDNIPQAMTEVEIDQLVGRFVEAANRAVAIGFDCMELHFAHGYLVHQFLSPLSNQRDDLYGGSLENRMRLALRLFKEVQQAIDGKIPLGVRLSASDWVDGGWDVTQSVELCRQLDTLGCDFFDVSSGGLSSAQKITPEPGFQVPFAAQIRAAVTAPVMAVGLITEPQQAEEILTSGAADMVALARGFLHDPRWPWRAAAELGAKVNAPNQYLRCLPANSAAIFAHTNPI